MASITKNLDNIIVKSIHRPSVDGIPLYTKIDASQEVGYSNKAESKSENWEKASKSTMTSPTNIRKVFITGDKVVVETYKPPIVKGKPDPNGNWHTHYLKEENCIKEFARDSLIYSQNMSKYYMEKAINPKAEEPTKITFKGTGLSALSSPWVASNIEELYFDWTLLMSEQYLNAAIGCSELLTAYLNGKRGIVKSNIPLDMFLIANSGNVKDIRVRFPRLRCLGLISELDKILEVHFDKGKPILDNVEDSGLLWYTRPKNTELIKKSNSLILINLLTEGLSKYNTNFTIREGIYRFDKEILKTYFYDYERKVKEYLRKPKNEENKVDEQLRTEKSYLEELLDTIATGKSLADAKSLLMLSIDGATMTEINDMFNEMSTEGEKKYRAMLK